MVVKVDAERDRHLRPILDPVRSVDRDVDAGARRQFEDLCPVLQMRFVDRGVVVDSPEALDLFLGQHLAVVAVEDAQGLRPANLEQAVTFAIDMVGADPGVAN